LGLRIEDFFNDLHLHGIENPSSDPVTGSCHAGYLNIRNGAFAAFRRLSVAKDGSGKGGCAGHPAMLLI
jgi:hypothetical protein